MKLQESTSQTDGLELHLLTEFRDEDRGRRALWAGAGAIAVHIVVFVLSIAANEYLPAPAPHTEASVDLKKAVPLILPRELLTQREPNKTKVAKELNLENLTARPQVRPTPRVASAPPAPPPSRSAPAAVAVPEPAQVNVAQAPPPLLGTTSNLQTAPAPKPPQIQQEEKPKLAFETPGLQSGKAGGLGRIQAPKTGIEDAMKAAARPGTGGVKVGDAAVDSDQPNGIGQMAPQVGSTPRQASSLELLSDPLGVDFKPYLIRVLAAVRQNWLAVIPESARYGRRGKVVLQFAISRNGGVPKLVIVLPSGTESFDRAAVAGVSASNPFPPLPNEFHGDQIRLQLAFSYNLPSR